MPLVLHNRNQRNRPYGETNRMVSFITGKEDVVLQPVIEERIVEKPVFIPVFMPEELPIVTPVEKVGWFKRFWAAIKKFFRRVFRGE